MVVFSSIIWYKARLALAQEAQQLKESCQESREGEDIYVVDLLQIQQQRSYLLQLSVIATRDLYTIIIQVKSKDEHHTVHSQHSGSVVLTMVINKTEGHTETQIFELTLSVFPDPGAEPSAPLSGPQRQ